jgi:ABC-type transport system involved in multi-copper enzyme maturation permease subunit
MGRRVLAITLNTYRECVRARILLGLAGVACAVTIYSIFVGLFTLRSALRVFSDLGAASISIFSILVAIVIGATSLYRELEQKTVFPILARPIRRGEYLVGKYLGTLLTLVVFIMADAGLVLCITAALGGRSPGLCVGLGVGSAALLAAAAWRWPAARTFGPIPWAAALLIIGAFLADTAPDERRVVLAAATLTVLEVGIVAAIATLFSSFSTPFLSALLTLWSFIVGRNADALARLPMKYFGQPIHDAGVYLSKVVPNLQIYVPPRPLLTGEAIEPRLSSYLAMAAVNALGWAIGLLAVAGLIFRKRDFL